MVDQEISQHRAAEGSDERCHHRVNQGRAPLSQNRKCERFWTLPLVDAHRELDAAVAVAYGWSVDISDEDALARLLELNLARAAAGTVSSGADTDGGDDEVEDDDNEE